ncbi:hypothetical protein QF028_002591 [Neobacillus sp. B4I6]
MKVNIHYGTCDFTVLIESYINSEMEKRANAGIKKPIYNEYTHGDIS